MITSSHLKISVRDTGIGIKPDDLKKLFKEFTRIETNEQMNINAKGVGLGLTIANKLAKRLGSGLSSAGIKVKSVHGQGSCFSFTIVNKSPETRMMGYQAEERNPSHVSARNNSKEKQITPKKSFYLEDINDENNSKQPIERPRIFSAKLSSNKNKINLQGSNNILGTSETCPKTRKRILIVDDEPFNILAIESFLHSLDLQVDTAFNGKEAVERVIESSKSSCPKKNYDLILMDCQMPIMDGYEATKALRTMMKRRQINDIPIIGCTAFNSEEKINLCYDAGMIHVLQKPVSKTKMDQIIKQFINSGE